MAAGEQRGTVRDSQQGGSQGRAMPSEVCPTDLLPVTGPHLLITHPAVHSEEVSAVRTQSPLQAPLNIGASGIRLSVCESLVDISYSKHSRLRFLAPQA